MSEEEREYLNETIRNLNNQLVDALRERDEARREICVMLEDATNNHRENHAKRWGWDCYKENTDA